MTFSTPSLILDIAVTVIFVLYILVDAIRGFFKSITSLVVLTLSVIVAVNFSAPVAEWIDEKIVNGAVTSKLEDVISDAFDKESGEETADTTADTAAETGTTAEGDTEEDKNVIPILENAGEELEKMFASLGTSSSELLSKLGKKAESTVRDVAEIIGQTLSSSISRIVAFIGLFIATSVVTWLIMKLLDFLFSGKCLKRFNSLCGALIGAVKGAVMVFIICYIACRLLPLLSGLGSAIPSDIIDNTYIVKFIGLY